MTRTCGPTATTACWLTSLRCSRKWPRTRSERWASRCCLVKRAALNEVSTSDMQAYDLYLRGREFAGRGTSKSDLDGAELMYQAAVDRDPRFAQALAGLSRMHLAMYWFYYDRNPERLARARAAAERAVELRPDLAASHAALGWYFYWGRLEFPAALSEFAAALTIEPNNGDALLGMSAVRRGQGRWTEAVDAVSKAAELDPNNAQLRFEVGFCLVLASRYSEADRAFGQAIALSPRWAAPYSEKARLQIDRYGDLERSQAVLDDAGRVPALPTMTGISQRRGWSSRWRAVTTQVRSSNSARKRETAT